MSVLYDRVTAEPQPVTRHPVGTPETPREEPHLQQLVHYRGGVASYEAVFPERGPDGEYAPRRAQWGSAEVIPAGRP